MIKNLKSLKTYLPLILLVVIVITLIVAGIRRQETQENFLGGRFKNSFNSGVSRNSGYRRASSNRGALRRSNKRWNNRYIRPGPTMDGARTKIQMHNNYRNTSITKLNQLPKIEVFRYFMSPPWKREKAKKNPWFRYMSDELQNKTELWGTMIPPQDAQEGITRDEFVNGSRTDRVNPNAVLNIKPDKTPNHPNLSWDVDRPHLKNEWIYCQFHPEDC